MKKKLSVILAVALILTSIPSHVFANDNGNAANSDPLLQAFIDYNIADVSITSEEDTLKTANITFENGTVNDVVITNEDGITIYEISEDSLTDIMTVNSQGEVALNGKLIGATNNSVQPMVINQPFQQTSCPFGSASDYTYKAGSEQKANISLDKAIKDYTLTALCALVLFYASPLLLSAVGGASTAVATALFTNWLANAKSAAPDSKALSYKLSFYHHKNYTNGTVTPAMMYIRKNVVTYYPLANYGGTSYNHTSYSGTIL